MDYSTESQRIHNRLAYLKTERSGYFAHWKEISEKILPRSGKFFGNNNTQQGQKKYNNIYDPTGTEAARILAAGMMSGNTSPARPWVRLGVDDPELNDYEPVKVWCSDVTKLMLRVFQKSNTYRALHSMYEEQGLFAVATSIILPDYNDVIRLYPMTVGEFYIAADSRGEIDTIYREFQMTVSQVVKEFGLDNCSDAVKSLYNSNKLDGWVPIIHAIEPRTNRELSKIDAKNMAWQSCYLEQGQSKLLRESGFEDFPGLCPRWSSLSLEAYGNNCPGMEALGAINQLQHQALRKAEAIDYKTKPPLFLPSSLKNRDGSLLPGGVTFVDGPMDSVRSAYEVNLDLSHLLLDIQDVRKVVRSAFSSDLFLMLSNGDNPRMTATEVAERREEKMTMLGPVIERQQNELLNPLIDKTFKMMVNAGLVPPAPPELQGRDIQVEFISVLAQAQKAIGTNSVDRFINSLAGVAQIKPEVLDKFDQDEWVDSYTDSLGTDPRLVVPTDKVVAIRKARAEQQAQQEQMAQLNQGADTANKLASAKTGDDSALTSIMRGLQGYN